MDIDTEITLKLEHLCNLPSAVTSALEAHKEVDAIVDWMFPKVLVAFEDWDLFINQKTDIELYEQRLEGYCSSDEFDCPDHQSWTRDQTANEYKTAGFELAGNDLIFAVN